MSGQSKFIPKASAYYYVDCSLLSYSALNKTALFNAGVLSCMKISASMTKTTTKVENMSKAVKLQQ